LTVPSGVAESRRRRRRRRRRHRRRHIFNRINLFLILPLIKSIIVL
jgi:hypothetical protein